MSTGIPMNSEIPLNTGIAPDTTPRTFFDHLFRFRGWLVIVTMVALLIVAWPPTPTIPRTALALPIVCLGAFIRVWARSYFLRGSDTRRIKSERLIVEGPYRHVRNPLYVGNILIQGGLLAAFAGWWPGAIFVVVTWILYEGIIRSEEPVLIRSHGQPYEDFLKKVPRWFPRPTPAPIDGELRQADFQRAVRKEWQRLLAIVIAFAVAVILALIESPID